MKTEFMVAITQLSAEKNLPREVVLSAVESALVSAYRKDSFSPNQDIVVKINPNTGGGKVYGKKTGEEETQHTPPSTRNSLGGGATSSGGRYNALPPIISTSTSAKLRQYFLPRSKSITS